MILLHSAVTTEVKQILQNHKKIIFSMRYTKQRSNSKWTRLQYSSGG